MFRRYIILGILGISILLTAFLPYKDDFTLIISLYSIAMGSYILFVKNISRFPIKELKFLWGSIVIGLVFAFPNLSDDIYRFYWDGIIVNHGMSPYKYLPSQLMNEGVIGNKPLFELLNSQEYYSVYPPVNQLLYWLSYKLSYNLFTFSVILKVFYLLIVILGLKYTGRLLRSLGVGDQQAFIYFLNPLVLIEGLGNLHIEIVMVSFLAVALYYYHKSKSGIHLPLYYSLSLSVKLVPLLMSPFFWFRQQRKWRWRYAIMVVVLTTLLLAPVMIGSGYTGFINSLDLYFRKFEFNGGIYYVFRYVGYQIKGYNLIGIIGPLLGIVTLGSILWMAIKQKSRDISGIISLSLIAWTLYLLLSTTVHPWYIMPLIFLGMLAGKWYPILWSYFIVWTYINYDHSEYFENLWVVAIEYILVLAAMGYEFKIGHKIKSLKG